MERKLKAYEAELTAKDEAENGLKSKVAELEKRIESLKREKTMFDQAFAMMKEKVATLSNQKRPESPERPSNVNSNGVRSIVLPDEVALKKKEEEFSRKLSVINEQLAKALKEKDMVLADLDRKQDQIASLKGDCTKYRQTCQKATKDKEKLKVLLNDLNKNFIEQGNALYELK